MIPRSAAVDTLLSWPAWRESAEEGPRDHADYGKLLPRARLRQPAARTGGAKLTVFALALLLGTMPTLADCRSDIFAVMDKSISSGPYRIDTVSEVMGTKVTTVHEVVPPGDMRKWSMMQRTTFETIVVGKRTWSKVAGKWIEMSDDELNAPDEFMPTNGGHELVEMTDPLCHGESVQHDSPVLTFSYRLVYDYGRDEEVSLKELTVDASTGLPLILMSINSLTGAESRSFSRYTYDANIVVTPPAGF